MTTKKAATTAKKYLLSDSQVELIISAMKRNSEGYDGEDEGVSEEYKEVRDTLFLQKETHRLLSATRKTKSTK